MPVPLVQNQVTESSARPTAARHKNDNVYRQILKASDAPPRPYAPSERREQHRALSRSVPSVAGRIGFSTLLPHASRPNDPRPCCAHLRRPSLSPRGLPNRVSNGATSSAYHQLPPTVRQDPRRELQTTSRRARIAHASCFQPLPLPIPVALNDWRTPHASSSQADATSDGRHAAYFTSIAETTIPSTLSLR